MSWEAYKKALVKKETERKIKENLEIMHLAVNINSKSLFDLACHEYNYLMGVMNGENSI